MTQASRFISVCKTLVLVARRCRYRWKPWIFGIDSTHPGTAKPFRSRNPTGTNAMATVIRLRCKEDTGVTHSARFPAHPHTATAIFVNQLFRWRFWFIIARYQLVKRTLCSAPREAELWVVGYAFFPYIEVLKSRARDFAYVTWFIKIVSVAGWDQCNIVLCGIHRL